MTDQNVTPDAAEAQVRDLAEIPAVEVITRAAIMLMSARPRRSGCPTRIPTIAHTATSMRRGA